MLKLFLLTISASLGLLIFSCSKQTDDIGNNYHTINVENMILVYISANNNLRSDALHSIEKLKEGVDENQNNALLVFVKTSEINSYLISIKKSNGIINVDTLKYYTNKNSANPYFLKEVINDSRRLVNAKKHGLVLWSHATSWLPTDNFLKTKSFGIDNGVEMDLLDLKEALPNDFEFILFDACYMGTIEVIYELKDKSKYIIAAPSEVLSDGFPYHTSLNLLFGDKNEYIEACKRYIDYYSNRSSFMESSAIISLFDCSHLEYLANYFSNAIKNGNTIIKNLTLNKKNKLSFQQNPPITIYDFESLLIGSHVYTEELTQLLDKVVVYKGNTENFLGNKVGFFSGVGITVPEKTALNKYYENLSWIKKTNFNLYNY